MFKSLIAQLVIVNSESQQEQWKAAALIDHTISSLLVAITVVYRNEFEQWSIVPERYFCLE